MKRHARIILLCALALVLVLALTACGSCKHENTVTDPAVEATCTEPGLTEGQHCEDCGEVLTAQEEVPALGHTEEVDPAVEPTCTEAGLTEGKHCSVCGEVLVAQEEVPALGHTTDTGTCERCGESFGVWSAGYYVDDFDQPTDQGFVWNETYFLGSFSNSATSDSILAVQVLVDTTPSVTFFLYEYGTNLVKNSSVNYVDTYTITMRTPDGTDHSLTGTMYCGGDRIFIDDAYYQTVIDALKSEGTISFFIVNDDRTTTNYLFSLEASNFATEYDALMGGTAA